MRINMVPETSKNRPTRLSAEGEKNVSCWSSVGFFILSPAFTIFCILLVRARTYMFPPSLARWITHPDGRSRPRVNVVSNEFLAIAWTFPRSIHKVIAVEYVVIISLNKWLASPKPVEVGAVITTRRLTKALQKNLVPNYINCPTFNLSIQIHFDFLGQCSPYFMSFDVSSPINSS
jgi:hypothetical protein